MASDASDTGEPGKQDKAEPLKNSNMESMDSIETAMKKAINRTSAHLGSKLSNMTQEKLSQGNSNTSQSTIFQGKPTAKIILEHESPHNGELVCLEHIHFLVRLLPYGRVTPVSELATPVLANMQRRKEEVFLVKTYKHFEALHKALADGHKHRERSWGTGSPVLESVPTLKPGLVQPQGCFARLCSGAHRNPNLGSDLQMFLDNLMFQLPSVTTEPAIQRFFETDTVPLTYPLVQQVLNAQGGSFGNFI